AGRTDRAIGRDLFDFYAIPQTDDNWLRYLDAYFEELPATLLRSSGSILPGVTPLIRHLDSCQNIFLGLLTGNFSEGASLKLRHYGLHDYFELGGFGDHHEDRDDVARHAFGLVQDRIPDVTPDDVWVIGDTPNDVKCGRAIGAKTLAVATGMYSSEQLAKTSPDILLNELTEANEWLHVLGVGFSQK
ncbi:MAG: haloacid dehalogenase, partial [Planctomycetes bacterium]|nr:haloacid dehalogenase [Planctomycetota bacterium]